MAVTCTNNSIVAFNTEVVIADDAATADAANLAEVFTITPTRPGNKMYIDIAELTGGGAVAFSVAAGVGHFGIGAAYTGSVATSTREGFMLNTANFLSAAGTILLTLTPASGLKLLTNHGAAVTVIEFPF